MSTNTKTVIITTNHVSPVTESFLLDDFPSTSSVGLNEGALVTVGLFEGVFEGISLGTWLGKTLGT